MCSLNRCRLPTSGPGLTQCNSVTHFVSVECFWQNKKSLKSSLLFLYLVYLVLSSFSEEHEPWRTESRQCFMVFLQADIGKGVSGTDLLYGALTIRNGILLDPDTVYWTLYISKDTRKPEEYEDTCLTAAYTYGSGWPKSHATVGLVA